LPAGLALLSTVLEYVDERPALTISSPSAHDKEEKFFVAEKSILLVEDEPLVRGTVLRVLSELGYDVIEMETGRDAVAFLEEPENCDKISLILSDVVMPGGVSGPELAEFAQLKAPNIRILLTSGYMRENLPDGVTYDLLSKPFNMKTLSQKIGQLLA
jgi:CheY-like chemotaxis protein